MSATDGLVANNAGYVAGFGTGLRPSFALEAFPKADDDVRQTAARVKANPFIPH